MREDLRSAKYPLSGRGGSFTGHILNINAFWEARCGSEHILDKQKRLKIGRF